MKHSQTGITKVGLINPDGHAIGLDIGATSIRAAILAPGTSEGRRRSPCTAWAGFRCRWAPW